MSEQPGWYARLEGVDGAGKTTLLEIAKEYDRVHGIGAVFTREPGGTPFGEKLRAFLLTDRTVHLSPEAQLAIFTGDRIHLWDTVISPALEQNLPVLSDRGIESSVYQTAGGGLSQERIYEVSALQLPARYMRPDAVALLSISKEVQRQRLIKRFAIEAADKMEQQDEEFFGRVFDGYKRLETLPYTTAVNAEQDPEEIFEDAKHLLFGPFARW